MPGELAQVTGADRLRSMMPTTRNSVDLNSACANTSASPAKRGRLGAGADHAVRNPSWLTVP